MIILYVLIAIFIAWIWVDYYRLIDIFESEKLKYFILTFFLGSASVLIVFGLHKYFLDYYIFELNGTIINDFLFSVFKIGLVEEIAKTIPFLIMYFLFRKEFNEPIDYIAFMCIAALGFSAAENLLYFQNHGPYIINGRAILATVGHMFDSSLIAYGIIRYKYSQKRNRFIGVILFFFLAALSHGFYDFWLLFEGTKTGGWVITAFYFLITLSLFAVIINNALNNSSFFTYKKVINSDKVAVRLLTYYGIVFLIQFVLLVYFENVTYALIDLIGSIFFPGFIVIVVCIRLSRFKLIKGRWEKLKIELPFSLTKGEAYGISAPIARIKIKGDSYNEAYINNYYEEFFTLKPVSQRKTHLGSPRLSYIERKLFLHNYKTFYLVKVFENGENGAYETMLVKPKTANKTMMYDKYPIVALMKINNIEDIENPEATMKDFKFKEWAYIKPRPVEDQ